MAAKPTASGDLNYDKVYGVLGGGEGVGRGWALITLNHLLSRPNDPSSFSGLLIMGVNLTCLPGDGQTNFR
jgi:hypothetical protein